MNLRTGRGDKILNLALRAKFAWSFCTDGRKAFKCCAFEKLEPINFNRKSKKRGQASLFTFMVEVTRFELATSTSRT